MESTCNPSKLLTITQKIQEEKELLQEKQNQLKNIKNYLTNLEYRKTQELNELEEYIRDSSIYQLENFKQVYPIDKPFNTVDNKWYVVIWRGDEKTDWKIIKFQNNIKVNDSIKIDIQNNNRLRLGKFGHLMINSGGFYWGEAPIWDTKNIKSVYRWNGIKNPNIKNKTVYFFEKIKN